MSPTPESGVEADPVLPLEAIPDVEHLVIEDGAAVDGIFAEKQYRLLTEPLHSCWSGPGEGRPWTVMANVGLFFSSEEPPVVPDVMLSLDVPRNRDLTQKKYNSYFIWIAGKRPDVVIEIVSDRRGGEDSTKLKTYARIGVPYYAIFDPNERLGPEVLRAFVLLGPAYQSLPENWFSGVGLGLTLWEGEFEGQSSRWLRWCDERGNVIPTGREKADQERRDKELLAAKLRELGIDPNTLTEKKA